MEVSEAGWMAMSIVFVSIIVRSAWNVLDWVWLKPKKLESCLREQGLKGKSYRFLYGDTKESSIMLDQAKSKPMNLSSFHDIAPRVQPLVDRTVKTYGKNSFVWIGPKPRVNIMNPKDVKDIFAKHNDFPRPINPLFQLAKGLASYEGEKWVKHRKMINPAFHFEKLKLMIPAFLESCDEIMTEWKSSVLKEGSSAELDVWLSLQKMTADVISRTAFGTSFQEGRKIFELQKEKAECVSKARRSFYVPGWRFLPTKMNRRMKEIDKEIKSILMGIIKKREQAIRAGESSKHDMLRSLLEASVEDIQDHHGKKKKNENFRMSIDEVIEECKLFYFAGQETTAVLLVWTIVLLCQYQNWQDRAREEVLQVFGTKKPYFDGLSHLKVVTMILHEVLRLYPPFFEVNRTNLNKTQLEEFSVPAGVEFHLPVLLMHHDKELWGDDADEFKPERFAEGVSKATKNQLSFSPFGAGPRICIGQSFAMTETKLVLALILQHFTFELSPSYVHAPINIFTLKPQYGAPIILHPR